MFHKRKSNKKPFNSLKKFIKLFFLKIFKIHLFNVTYTTFFIRTNLRILNDSWIIHQKDTKSIKEIKQQKKKRNVDNFFESEKREKTQITWFKVVWLVLELLRDNFWYIWYLEGSIGLGSYNIRSEEPLVVLMNLLRFQSIKQHS